MGLSARARASRQRAKLPSSMSFYVGCHQKVPFTFWVGLPVSNNLTKKVPHRSMQRLGCRLTPDLVKLMAKISRHTLPVPGLQACPLCLDRCWGIELRSSCLRSKHFTDQAIAYPFSLFLLLTFTTRLDARALCILGKEGSITELWLQFSFHLLF